MLTKINPITLQVLLGLAVLATPAAAADRASFDIPTTNAPPKIDGDLSDDAWKGALRGGDYVRFNGSAPFSQQTETWVTTDGKNLYVAFYCHDKEPDKIRASETQRGSGAVDGDDHVTVVIDSQHLHRGASTFAVNPLGTQLERLESGTAGNITWSGNWFASSKRVADGWVCEMSIPFKLMRHQPNTKAIGLLFLRAMAREPNPGVWPALPPEGQTPSAVTQFMADFRLKQPIPDDRPKPVILPFTIATADKDGVSAMQGVDVKLPFSPTITGLISVNPGFQTVEQQVANVNFSYNEQYVPDRRPFFSEGAEFLPDPELFYSQRITNFDVGTKVVGRQGNTSVGFLASSMRSGKFDRDTNVLAVKQNVGLFSDFGVFSTVDNLYGIVANRTAKAYGNYGWVTGDRRNNLIFSRAQSWIGSDDKGGSAFTGYFSSATNGKLRYSVTQSSLSQDFISTLGLLANQDRKSNGASIGLRNQFDNGKLFSYDVSATYDNADRLTTGDFFYETLGLTADVQLQNGFGGNVSSSGGRRQQALGTYFEDRMLGGGFNWNSRRLFQGGGIGFSEGRQGGFPVKTWGLGQGFFMRKGFTMGAQVNQQALGSITTRQTVITGTYRLDSLRTVSGRLVSQNGTGNLSAIGSQVGTNLYFAYEQRSGTKGIDMFVLLGDPNAANTTAGVTVKLTKPI